MKQLFKDELRALVTLKQTDRGWQVPILAALAVGLPLLAGLYLDSLAGGLLASLSGLVILYMPAKASFAKRMIVLLTSSFGFMVSFAVGLFFSYNPVVASIMLGLFSMLVHYITKYFKVRPPGNFFFIMLTAIAICQPYDLASIPEKIGYIWFGTMGACILGLLYSLMVAKQKPQEHPEEMRPIIQTETFVSIIEAGIIGLMMFAALLLGHLLEFENPYWIPTSCLAVMQGASRYHIWQRTFHRVLGTFLGLGLCWLLLSFGTAPIYLCLSIMLLQGVIEFLVVRQYALAVIFITPLTIFLAEAADPLLQHPDVLITARLVDISIGSAMGALGGWILYHENVRYQAVKRMRKARIALKKRS